MATGFHPRSVEVPKQSFRYWVRYLHLAVREGIELKSNYLCVIRYDREQKPLSPAVRLIGLKTDDRDCPDISEQGPEMVLIDCSKLH